MALSLFVQSISVGDPSSSSKTGEASGTLLRGNTKRTVDLTKIERRIKSEPAYTTASPEYCLLVFGQEGKTRVWVVRDGNTFYVDRNANGVIGEQGEGKAVNKTDNVSIGWKLNVTDPAIKGDVSVGYRSDGSYEIDFATDIEKPELSNLTEVYQSAGWIDGQGPRFTSRPSDAPIIHFDGPLTFRRLDGKVKSKRRQANSEQGQSLRLMVGTNGLGENTFVAYLIDHRTDIPGTLHARIEFPVAEKDSSPITHQVKLKTKPEG